MADESFIVRLEFDASQPEAAYQALARAAHQANKAIQGTDAASAQTTKSFNAIERAAAKAAKGVGDNAKAAKSLDQSLSTTRYALYDVSSTLGIAGIAMVGLAAATYAVGIAWEKNFSAVLRTSGVYAQGTEAVDRMRREFMELGQTIPTTTKEIAEIGALGGQLGIAANGLDEFTGVVAKLTATTDLSAEAAGTALGRFNALFEGIDETKFEALASSILKVGVNSVATETQIVNIGTQISSMGAFAGLTAEQVIGLSGALASVGAQPELSRGTITRVFTLMSRAVAQGGEKLTEFARISGMSAADFRNSWGTAGFASTFQSFLKGVAKEGDSAVASLNGLGVTSVRDVPLLLRLANAGDVVTKSFQNSKSGFEESTELANQYGVIAETTAAKLQILANNFEIFLAAMADGGTVFGGLIDGLTGVLKIMTDIAQNPVGGTIMQIGLIATGVAGILLLGGAGIARSLAAVIAMKQAMIGLGIQLPITGGAAAATSGALQAVGISATAASRATAVLSASLKGFIVAAAFVGLGALSDILHGWGEAADGADNSFAGLAANLGEVSKEMRTFAQGTSGQTTQQLVETSAAIDVFVKRGKGAWAEANQGISTFFNDLGWYATSAERDFTRIDQAMQNAVESGDFDALSSQLAVVAKETGLSVDEMINTFPRLRGALDDAGVRISTTADGMYKFRDASGAVVEGVNAIAAAEEEAAAKAEMFATSIGFESGEALTAFQESLSSSSAGFVNFGDLIQRVQDQTRGFAEKQSLAAYGSKDSWQKFYDGSSVNIQAFSDLLGQQIVKQGAWADNMQILTARGATAFVSELAKMGPEGAPLAEAAVNMTSAELMKLEDQAYLAAFLASDAFAQGFVDQTPFLMDTYEAGGLEAVSAMITALRTGNSQVEAVAREYGVKLENNPLKIPVKTTGVDTVRNALNGLLGLVNSLSGRTAVINTQIRQTGAAPGAVKAAYNAQGGYIRGPGTGTSDSILSYLSNGEYVVRASAVRALGLGYLNAINQGRRPQQFATGGLAGRASGGQAIGTGIMELGPKSLGRLGGAPQVNVFLDDVAIANAARRGNAKLRQAGR